MKTVIQLDFDGTVTTEDVGFLLLDKFVDGEWRKYLDAYNTDRMSLGAFSKKVFGMIKVDKKTLTDFVLNSDRVKVRLGFREFLDYCKNSGIEVVIVSNGLTFYIVTVLEKSNIDGLDIHAAENVFSSDGMKVRYLSPDGKELDAGFKEAYTDFLCQKGYRVIYIGDGNSDIYSSRKAKYLLATSKLLQRCREENHKCYPFNDFSDVIKALEIIK